jgi:Tol biopolymer transport system component
MSLCHTGCMKPQLHVLMFGLMMMLLFSVSNVRAGDRADQGLPFFRQDILTYTRFNPALGQYGDYEIVFHDLLSGGRYTLPIRPYQDFYGWSETGRFAFLSDVEGNTEVYVWEEGKLTNISQHPMNDWRPAISPDGRVAFASERDGNMEIYVWDGEALTNVSKSPLYEDYPSLSADGYVAYMQTTPAGEDIVIQAVGAQRDVLVHIPGSYVSGWSQDGRLALMNSSGGVQVVDIFTGMLPTIISTAGYSTRFSWSRDGRLAFEVSSDIYVWDGQATTPLIEHEAQDFSPAWSSDGRLAFVSTREGYSAIYVRELDGTIRRITAPNESVSAPVWKP